MVDFVPAEQYFEPNYSLPHYLGARGKRSEIQDNEIRAEFELGEDADYEIVPVCPACGEYINYCQGHGEMGDPSGHRILHDHDNGLHHNCHPFAECED